MNWQVRNPLRCTTDGCTAKAEIEALREKVDGLIRERNEWRDSAMHGGNAGLYGPPMAIGNVLSKDALATHDDSSALDALLEEAYSKGYQESKDKYGDLT